MNETFGEAVKTKILFQIDLLQINHKTLQIDQRI